jgi:NDP-sugar pyrophosphorylase family protein
MWGLLERCLEHPSLGRVKGWLDENIPNLRDVPLMAKKLNPDQAIILAAGLGTRMLPLTEDMPKPLIKVAGKEMLTWTLDALAWAGVKRAVINKHHHADQIDMFVNERIDWRPEILLSDESDLLMDSGGGIKKGLKQLSNEPFFIINSDMIWQNEGLYALTRLATAWDDNMDMLMLLIKREAAHGHDGAGDFHMAKDGCLSWRGNSSTADYLYSGIMIIRPECFEDTPDEPFSLKILFDRAEKQKKLFGIVHTGSWYHVGTPEAIGETEKRLKGK